MIHMLKRKITAKSLRKSATSGRSGSISMGGLPGSPTPGSPATPGGGGGTPAVAFATVGAPEQAAGAPDTAAVETGGGGGSQVSDRPMMAPSGRNFVEVSSTPQPSTRRGAGGGAKSTRRSGGGSKASLDMGSPSPPSKSKSIQNLSSIAERAPSASPTKRGGTVSSRIHTERKPGAATGRLILNYIDRGEVLPSHRLPAFLRPGGESVRRWHSADGMRTVIER